MTLVHVNDAAKNNCKINEFRNKETRQCIACTLCGFGFKAKKSCGDGYGDQYDCVACPSGEFKDTLDLETQCKPWLDCVKKYNRVIQHNGTAQKDAVCGACIKGYNDHAYSDIVLGNSHTIYACSPDSDSPAHFNDDSASHDSAASYKQQTMISKSGANWQTIVAIVIGITITGTVIIGLLVVKRNKTERSSRYQEERQTGCNSTDIEMSDITLPLNPDVQLESQETLIESTVHPEIENGHRTEAGTELVYNLDPNVDRQDNDLGTIPTAERGSTVHLHVPEIH